MDDPVVAQTVCLRCNAALDAGDNFCRHCGASTGRGATNIDGSLTARSATPSRAFDSLWVMVAMLFLVAGPFALPLLWRSQRYSLAWKYILTFLVFAEAVLLLWLIWFILHLAFEPIGRAMEEVLGSQEAARSIAKTLEPQIAPERSKAACILALLELRLRPASGNTASTGAIRHNRPLQRAPSSFPNEEYTAFA
jgi:hypothetical protein